jgi:hypothetical protein
MKLVEHSELIRQRARQPIVIDGATFVPTVEYAALVGFRADYFHKLAASCPTTNEVATVNGHSFVRIPRHRGDTRSPIYWKVQS